MNVFNDYAGVLPTDVGQQVHVNHKDCSAGTDTKKRLYIKRVAANSCVYYCHHCKESGVSYERMDEKKWDRVVATVDEEYTTLIPSVIYEPKPITDIQVVSYLRGYDINDDDVEAMRLFQVEPTITSRTGHTGIAIPNTTWVKGEAFRGQVRYFISNVSRYHTHGKDQTNLYDCNMGRWKAWKGGVNTLFIVEDSISAYRIVRDCRTKPGTYAISLNGSGCNDQKVKDILSHIEQDTKIVIWLDDDNAGKDGSMELMKNLTPLVSKTNSILVFTGLEKEPKLLDKARLEFLVDSLVRKTWTT